MRVGLSVAAPWYAGSAGRLPLVLFLAFAGPDAARACPLRLELRHVYNLSPLAACLSHAVMHHNVCCLVPLALHDFRTEDGTTLNGLKG